MAAMVRFRSLMEGSAVPASILVLSVLFASLSAPALAQCGTCVDETKLQAGDAAGAIDYFGGSVALSGDMAVVGAPSHDHGGRDAGAVYVYRDRGYGWVQEAEILAAVPTQWASFGSGVAISGGVMVVGARQDFGAAYYAGAAHVFRHDGTSWVEEQKLYASDAAVGDDFGRAVAIDRQTIVVGAGFDDDPVLGDNVGSAYVFRFDGTSWVEEAKLVASDAEALGRFGLAVDVSGDRIAVGATGSNGSNGKVYVFSRGPSGWVEEEIVIPTGLTGGHYFGSAVAIEGGLLAVGAFFEEGGGMVLVYRHDGVSWVEEDRFTGSGQPTDRGFGNSLALDGGSLVVGTSSDSVPGAAYLFKRGCAGWYEVARTTPSDGGSGGASNEYYGSAVAVDGDRLLVGAYLKRLPDGSAPGAAYIEEVR